MKTIKAWRNRIVTGLGNRFGAERFPSDPFDAQHRLLSKQGLATECVFDVGANKGKTAEKYRSLFPNAEIYSFEAFPDLAATLNDRFRGDTKTHVVAKAVGRQPGSATFYVNEREATSSLLPRPSGERRYYPKSAALRETIEVEVVSLDGFASAKKVTKIDVLKMDIQGGELNALQGARGLLADGGVSMIYIEIAFVPHYEGGPLFHEIWSFLADYGYSLFNMYGLRTAGNGQIRYGDALFVSRAMRENVVDQFSEEP